MFRNLLAPAGLVALAWLAGCSSNPITGRSQFMVVPESTAISESTVAYNSMMGDLGKKKKVERDTARVAKVREITDRLIAQAVRFRPDSAKWKWEVQVIDDPKTVNAFCMAGGKMAIYSGMWEKLKATDAEVAQVMGHEIGHALANHTQERMSIAMTSNVGLQVLGAVIAPRDRTGLAMTGAGAAALLAIQLPNSRQSEAEADQIGIELAARAGFDPAAAVSLWEKMGKLGGTPPEFMSTHPSPEHRKERLQELGAKVHPLYVAAAANPTANAPNFLNSPEAVNERTVSKAGEMTREEYAAKVAKEGETLTFLSEPFEKFKRGETVFDCREQCSFGYLRAKSNWRRLYDKQQWRDLAVSVLQTGYLSDYSYFLLAEAAKGMSLPDASRRYYERALEAGKEYSCGESCEGFDVQKRVKQALAQK